MWKIAVCDDQEEVRNGVVKYIDDIGRKLCEDFSVECFESVEELLENMSADTDILLLDIKMNEMTGIDAARKIRESNERLHIIFVTEMTQYAMEGYEVHAFGFLKKPVTYFSLERYITEAVYKLKTERNDFITINDKGKTHTLSLSEVVYIEAFAHDIIMLTTKGENQITTPLSKLEEKLSDKGFFRCHKSYLINMRHIRSINKDSLLMTNDKAVPLSKHRKKKFMESFIKFSGGIL